jgi:hypothetical protein
MRLMSLAMMLLLALATPALAQEWEEFVSPEDGFKVNFPGKPKMTPTTYESEYGAPLPAHVYSADRGREHYSLTSVDYAPIEQLLTERAKACPPYADERCTGFGGGATVGAGYWKTDIRGALVWASWQYLKRDDMKATHYMWNFMDLVEGHQLQLTSLKDKSRTFVSIYMHMNKLYVLEGTVPAGYPPPALFQQSIGFVDKAGNGIRYRDYYDNDYPPPPLAGRGGGAGPAAAPNGAPAGQAPTTPR